MNDEAHNITYLTVIKRDTDPPEVFSFTSLADALEYFRPASEQWSDSFLANVIYGPGRPPGGGINPLADDRRRALRAAHELTLETQTCEEAVADLIRIAKMYLARAEAAERALYVSYPADHGGAPCQCVRCVVLRGERSPV